MILKGSQRGGAKQLSQHLLKTLENEHVEVHDIRGFVSDNLRGALQEAYAISQGTRCRQFLFSLSLNPPETENVPVEAFEKAIEKIEAKLGLDDQPRAIVFHEKEGRRHAHCVWSRIDGEEMKAINLPHFKLKLRDVSKSLYLEHGWTMPKGLVDSTERDPTNYTREQWQQAKRAKMDPRALKAMFQECWAISDSRQAFTQALKERGYHLAQGDRRAFVAVDFRGKVYSISKWVGIRPKVVADKLGDPKELQGVEKTKKAIATHMTDQVRDYIKQTELELKQDEAKLAFQRTDLTQRHRDQREKMREFQRQRRIAETNQRSARLAKGMRGIWERITGKYAKIRRENEIEAYQAHLRDRAQRQGLIDHQRQERQTLQQEVRRVRERHHEGMAQLNEDVAYYLELVEHEAPDMATDRKEATKDKKERKAEERRRRRNRGIEFEI